MKTNLYRISALFAVTAVASLGAWTYTQAEGNQIEVCVKKSGLIYVIGEEFKRNDCKKNDSLLSWNIQGIPGPKGDKGDTGPQGTKGDKGDGATHGAGQFAFVHTEPGAGRFVLKTDGTIWRWNGGFTQVINTPDIHGAPDYFPTPSYVPVPVEDIVSWNLYVLVDKDGNGWNYSGYAPFWTMVGFPQ